MADDTKRRLWRYKSDIEEGPDEEKLLQILAKLHGLPVTIALLQETGIGRMVNRYRNKDGLVGDKARAVVAKWKSVVENEVHKVGTTARKSPTPSPAHSEEDEAEASDTNSWNSFNAQSRNGGSDSDRKHDQSDSEDDKCDDSDMERSNGVSGKEVKVKVENSYSEAVDSHLLNNERRRGSSKKSRSSDGMKYDPRRTVSHELGTTTGSSGSESEVKYKPSRIPEAAKAMTDEEYRPDSRADTEMYIPSKIKKEPSSSEGGESEEEEAYTPVMSVGGKRDLEKTPYIPTKKTPHSKYTANSSSELERGSDEDSEYVPSKKRKLHKKKTGMGNDAESSRGGGGRDHSHTYPRRDEEELTDSDAEDGYGESSVGIDDYYHSLLSGALDKDAIKQEKGSKDALESRILSGGGTVVGGDRDNRREERKGHLKRPHNSVITSGSSRSHHSRKEENDGDAERRKKAANHSGRKGVDRKQKCHNLSGSEDEASTAVDTYHLDSSKNASCSKSSSSRHRHQDHSSSGRSSSSASKPSSLSVSHGRNSSVKPNSAKKDLKNHELSSKYDPGVRVKEEKISDNKSSSSSSSSSSRVPNSTAYHSSKERDRTKDSKRHSSSHSSRLKKDHISSSSSHARHKEAHKSSSPSNPKDIIDISKPSSSSKDQGTCIIVKSGSSSSSKHRESHRSSSSSNSNHSHSDKSSVPVNFKHCESSTKSHPASSDQHDRNHKSGLSLNSKHSDNHKPSSSSNSKHKHNEKLKSHEEGSEKNRDVSSSHHKSQKSVPSKNHKKDKRKDTGGNFETNFFSEPILIKPEPPSALPVNRSRNFEAATMNKPASSPKRTSATASTLPNSSSFGRERLKGEATMSRNQLCGSRSSEGSEVKAAKPLADHTIEISERKSKPGVAKADRIGSGKAKKRKEDGKTIEIDESNMSFEDFMNIEETMAVVKKKKPSVKYSNKIMPSQKSSSSSPNSRPSKSSSNKESRSDAACASTKPDSNAMLVPEPSTKVEVTAMDILSSLPETQAHYRPLRFNPYLKDEEEHVETTVDSDSIGMKPNLVRTQVYSGRRTKITEVKPLFELCMQVLIENIDAIDYVGGIPYSILKPVLERCSSQQLYQLEDFNPHFLEDTEELWEELCLREFRGSERDELETWRELYLRKFEERQEKYQKLKASMSANIVKGQAGRKAKLAYVDSVAKPPREVLRKQKQFGTGCVVRTKGNQATPGSCSGLKAYKPSTIVPAHNPMNVTRRDVRPTPAMMAKALQMRKNMRR